MSDNDRNESPMPSSRILNRSDTTEGFASRDKGLAGSESESGVLSGVASGSGRAPTCGESATNPATSARQLTDTPVGHAKNGLQILSLIRSRDLPPIGPGLNWQGPTILRLYGERAYVITASELKAVEDRIMAAIAQLEEERQRRFRLRHQRGVVHEVREDGTVRAFREQPGAWREVAPDPALVEQLRQMERTNAELRDQSDGFHDVAAAGVDR